MTSGFVPLALPHAERVRLKPREDLRLAWCILAAVLVIEGAARFQPDVLALGPFQARTWFKQLTGYTMLALMAAAMAFGWLRRLPAFAGAQRACHGLHQFGGLLVLLLLASHAGPGASGFLLGIFHAMALAVSAGALRVVLGPLIGRSGSRALLAAHIGLSCLVAAAALLHLYFVYAYTA
jgi:hypothetical protein